MQVLLKVGGWGESIVLFKKEDGFYLQAKNEGILDILDKEDRLGLDHLFEPEQFDTFKDAFHRMKTKYPIFKLVPPSRCAKEIEVTARKKIRKNGIDFDISYLLNFDVHFIKYI